MSTQQAPGLPVSVHGHPNADTLLLWHPAARPGVDADPDALAALATRIAGRGGFRVVVPRWADGRDLLRSVRFARESAVHPPDELSVVGYGVAGIAALGLALHQRRLRIGLSRVTCVDGGDGLPDPISGSALPDPVPAAPAGTADLTAPAGPGTGTGAPGAPGSPTKVDVIAGHAETAAAWARRTTDAWRAAGWDATLVAADQFTWRL